MKLLFDQNLSPRSFRSLQICFPDLHTRNTPGWLEATLFLSGSFAYVKASLSSQKTTTSVFWRCNAVHHRKPFVSDWENAPRKTLKTRYAETLMRFDQSRRALKPHC